MRGGEGSLNQINNAMFYCLKFYGKEEKYEII